MFLTIHFVMYILHKAWNSLGECVCLFETRWLTLRAKSAFSLISKGFWSHAASLIPVFVVGPWHAEEEGGGLAEYVWGSLSVCTPKRTLTMESHNDNQCFKWNNWFVLVFTYNLQCGWNKKGSLEGSAGFKLRGKWSSQIPCKSASLTHMCTQAV